MKQLVAGFVTFSLLILLPTPTTAQVVTSKTKCGYFMPFFWHTAMPEVFDLTVHPDSQEMTVIPLDPNFQGIQSIAIHSEFHCNAEPDCGPYEFIVPWHPDSTHFVPLPEEFFTCGTGVQPYVWRICWVENLSQRLKSILRMSDKEFKN